MISSSKEHIRVRFAPSPTGNLHLGGARVAIFNWLFAKSNQGKFLVRIEDTDKARSTNEFKNSILSSLEWLGITIDEPIVIQSSNEDLHKQIAFNLIESGNAYKCYCSQEELDESREAFSSDKGSFVYPGTCSKISKDEADKDAPFVVRFRLPTSLDKKLWFDDLIKGRIEVDSSLFDDFVLLKSDLTPTYNFAVVIDDIYMKISHILRGEDHIINTFKQIFLYNALKSQSPFFGHFPMILSASGERLSKRHGATSVTEYQALGILPNALFNYLVRLGWSHGDQEVFSKEELISYFSLDNVGKKNAIFDTEKLLWLNSVYLKNLSFLDFVKELQDPSIIESTDKKLELLPEKLFHIYKDRYQKTGDIALSIQQILRRLSSPRPADLNQEILSVIKEYFAKICEITIFSTTEISSITNSFLTEKNLKLPILAKNIRILLSGKEDGPSLFMMLEALGKDNLINFLKLIT